MAVKRNGLVCTMCGNVDCTATPVVKVLEGLNLCTDCISFIDESRDVQLQQRKKCRQEQSQYWKKHTEAQRDSRFSQSVYHRAGGCKKNISR